MEFLVGVVAVVGIMVLIFAFMAMAILFRGYVLSVLWGWFMVPTLGLPELPVAQAIGIALVVGMLTHQTHHYAEDKNEATGKKVARVAEPLLTPLIALLVGWVVLQFM